MKSKQQLMAHLHVVIVLNATPEYTRAKVQAEVNEALGGRRGGQDDITLLSMENEFS